MTDGGVYTGYYFIKRLGVVRLNRSTAILIISSLLPDVSRSGIFDFSDFFDFQADAPPKINDLGNPGFGLWFALSLSKGKRTGSRAWAHSKGKSIMLDQLRNEIGKRAVASSCDPAADEELVAAAKKGDELGFESLAKRHQRRIFALAFRYTRVRQES